MRAITIDGELGIHRTEVDDRHVMRITVRKRGVVIELECGAEDFVLALTGRAALPVSAIVNMKRLAPDLLAEHGRMAAEIDRLAQALRDIARHHAAGDRVTLGIVLDDAGFGR